MKAHFLVVALLGAFAFASAAPAAPMFKGAAPEASVFPDITSVNLMTLIGASSGGGRPVACPQGNSDPNDGCAAAPAPLTAAFSQPNAFVHTTGYFNSIAATTADYTTTRPKDHNVAGVDYHIANYTPALSTCALTVWDGTCLLDPALIGSTITVTGCSYSTTASISGVLRTGGGVVLCAGAVSQLKHFNFGAINGHDCTALYFNGSVSSSTLALDDLNFFNNSGICGVGVNKPQMLLINSTFTGGVTATNILMDGDSSVFDNAWGGISPVGSGFSCNGTSVQCNPWNALGTQGNSVAFDYVVIRNFAATIINPGVGSIASVSFKHSWIQTWCVRMGNCHAEWLDQGGNSGLVGSRLIGVDYTTILSEGSQFGNANFGPTPLFRCNAPMCPLDMFSFTHNVQINAWVGGTTANVTTFSACIGHPPTGGNAATPTCSTTAPGDGILYVTQSSPGSVSHGQQLSCAAVGPYHRIPPSPTYPALVVDEWSLDQEGSFTYFPNVTVAASCINATAGSNLATVAVSGDDHGSHPLGAANITDNYLDVSSQGGGVSPLVFQIGNPSDDPGVSFTGTIDGSGNLTTSISISPFVAEFVGWTGQADACSASVLNCPRIVSGSGTSFVVSGSSAIGPIAMRLRAPVWCTTTPIFARNVDMTGVATNLNAWSSIASNVLPGC